MLRTILINKFKNETFRLILNILMVIIASTMLFYLCNRMIDLSLSFSSNSNNVMSIYNNNPKNIEDIDSSILTYSNIDNIISVDYCIDSDYNLYYRRYYDSTINNVISINERYPQIVLSEDCESDYFLQGKDTVVINQIEYKIIGYNDSDKNYCNIVNNEDILISMYQIEFNSFATSEEVTEEKAELMNHLSDVEVSEPTYERNLLDEYYIGNSIVYYILITIIILLAIPYFINLNKENRVLYIIGISRSKILLVNITYHILIILLSLMVCVGINLLIDQKIMVIYLKYFLFIIASLTIINLTGISIRILLDNKRSYL